MDLRSAAPLWHLIQSLILQGDIQHRETPSYHDFNESRAISNTFLAGGHQSIFDLEAHQIAAKTQLAIQIQFAYNVYYFSSQ